MWVIDFSVGAWVGGIQGELRASTSQRIYKNYILQLQKRTVKDEDIYLYLI